MPPGAIADPTDGSITYGTRADEFSKFIETLFNLRDTLTYPETDARPVLLNNLIGAASGARTVLRLLHAIDPDIAKDPPEALMSILQLKSTEHVKWAKHDLDRTGKIAFLLDSQFQIETFFRNVLRSIRAVGDTEGFGGVARDVLKHFDLPDRDRKLALLKVPAKIRNSLHQNGIHAFEEKSEDLGVFSGYFRKHDRVSCGNYGFLLIAIWSTCEILEELLTNVKMCDKKFIEDRYAALKAKADDKTSAESS